MGSTERSKKKVQVWKKAIVHFSLCFVMGFFTGFAPTGKASTSIFSTSFAPSNNSEISPQPIEIPSNPSLTAEPPKQVPKSRTNPTKISQKNQKNENKPNLKPKRLMIIVTPTSTRDRFQGVFLRKLANTLRLVPQPLVWIVVEAKRESSKVSEILRKTGIMYRHLVFKENFTDPEAEMNHQRNVALKHIEHHKLSGIVHFAGLYNVYDLRFFDELREIEVFGTWPLALLTANQKKAKIEGAVCESSKVIGWHLKKMNNETDTKQPVPIPIHISSFAFNSSILWDPERWGRTSSSVQDVSQKSVNFVKQVVVEDEANLKGIPAKDCSKIMLWQWHLRLLSTASPPNQLWSSSIHDSLTHNT